jgi:hypothetical protein
MSVPSSERQRSSRAVIALLEMSRPRIVLSRVSRLPIDPVARA